METEVISITAAMMNGDDDTVGFMTSGGTESILMAVKAYRDRARKLFPHIKNPEIVSLYYIYIKREKGRESYLVSKLVL